jgi:carbamoyltransferase
MNILGITNTKDSGACLVVDGTLVSAANEERFTREKLTRAFPARSIEWVMRQHGLRPQEIDAVATGAWKGIDSWQDLPGYVDAAMERTAADGRARDVIMSRLRGSIRSDRRQSGEYDAGLVALGLDGRRRIRCYHHEAHAVAAFQFSPFDHALVVTLDGRGDFISGSVSTARRGEPLRLLRTELELDSLGAFYGWITQYLGFTADRHEGKVTGLAARGNPQACGDILRRSIGCADGRIRGHIGPYYAPFMRAELPELRRALAPFSREDVAAAAQAVLEEVTTAYVRYYLEQSGETNLCLAGGVFANVLVNHRLHRLPGVRSCFVFPHMGDGGIAAGAAAYAVAKLGGAVQPLESVYLGPQFSAERCRTAIEAAGLTPERPPDLATRVAEAIDRGAVIGLFQGRMEYGPRALGNRSILARATDARINDDLNRRLARSEFMPFAPVTLTEHAADCYVDLACDDPMPRYMTACYACTPRTREQTPAIVHVDGTARPQVISRGDNPFYYDIVCAYYRRAGIPTLINTSFNEHEAPIVCEPEAAVEALVRDAIDLLAMPPFLVRR